jgi:hypothetical protein
VGYVDVYRNGVYLPTSDYTATTGTTVVLTNAATVGDTITTISFFVSSVLNAIPATAGSVSTSYLVDGSVTTAKLADANVTQAKLGTGVAGNGPAFSAYMGTNQTVTTNTETKLQVNTKEFDTATCYSTTNYRFTPNVAGYYQINGQAYFFSSGGFNGNTYLTIYKNGSRFKDGGLLSGGGAVIYFPVVSALIYLNGTTDYVELWGNITGAGTVGFYVNAPTLSYFQASMVRSA